MDTKRVLLLPVKKQYFLEIRAGSKTEEYRLAKGYWQKRLLGREYDEIHVTCGYPSASDKARIEVRPWRGFMLKTITHPEFGDMPVQVFAIVVN